MNLFEYAATSEAKRAIDQVEENADEQWFIFTTAIVQRLALSGRRFTTDDVWSVLAKSGLTTHEPRAMGAVLRNASRDKIIVATGDYVRSERVECHARPIMVWRGV